MFQPFKDLPKALVDLFEDIYMNINKDPQESKAYQTALIIFRWLLCAQAPVPVEDLVRALDVYMAGDSIGCDAGATDLSVPMVLECCQDLIVVDKDSNEFRFVHTAVRDFLEQKDELQPQAQHAAVADLCLATVKRFAFETMAISSLTRDIFYYYVVVYWALHVAQAGQEHGIDTINDALNDLCQELPWFKSWLPQIQPASSLVLEWNDPHKDKIIQALSSPATSFFTACAFGFNNVVHYLVQLKKDLLDKRNDLGAMGLHLAAGYGHLEIAEALCRAGAEVDPIDNDGETPLIRAAAGGYEALVLMLLKAGASVRTQGRWYGTALHGAALHGHVGAVRILLDHGADIKATGGQFGTALHAACLRGHVRVVKRLLDAGAEAEVPDRTEIKSEILEESKGGCTTAASILSVVKGVLEQERASVFGTRGYPSKPRESEATFQLLLDQDVDLNILPEGFGLPLHTAARAGHEAVVKVLLNYSGISPNSIGGEYGSALQAAALSGRTSIVKQLLNAKAYPDMQAGKYGTALIAACRQASLGVVELLLTSGASVNVQAGVYGTALHAACRSGNHLLVQRLLNSGADVKLTGGEYCTALQAAARDGYEKLVQLLLQHGADVNVKGGSFGSALQAAAVGGYKRVVMLLKADADVDDGLELACLGGHQEVAELLLAYGSDLNHSSRAFKSPLQAALVGRHASLARWLLEKGAKAISSSWGTSLQLAALAGDAELVGLCLKQGADPWEKACVIDEKGLQQFGVNLPICTKGSSPFPMVIAVAGGYIQIVTLLLDAQPPDASMRSDDRDNSNDEFSSDFHDMYLAWSPVQRGLYDALLLALETNQEEIVSLLLHHALPIDPETIEYACGMAKPSVVISLLELAEKHTPEQNNHYKNLYALSKAARNGKLELVELLLPRVVKSKKLVSGDLAEALHNAVYCESLEMVNQLLEYGADPTLESDSFKQSCYAKLDFNGVTLSAAVSDGQRDTVRAMLVNKASIDMSDYYYGTVLQRAAHTGAEDILTDLLDSGADVNAVGGFYGTAVQAAAAGGHESIVQRLICAGANLHYQGGLPDIWVSREIQQDWQNYCSSEDLQWWKKLTKKFNQVAEAHPIRKQSGFHGTALQAAAVTGNAKIVAMLIEAGADINDIDWFGQTPLHRAAYYGHSVVVTLLLAKGADIEAIDREGRSPILLAASMGHREIFACLLTLATESGTNSVVQEQQLLHSASRYGHIGIIEHLMAERNIVERLDDNGQTALFIAASNGQCPTVRFLIDKGSDIHHRAHDRRTALHFAAESGHDDVARLLLKFGANMLAVDNSGQSALHYAASNGHSKVVYLLMEQGAPPNLQDYSGMTPLHLAVRSESSETIVFLLDKGANVNAKANNGDTPLESLPRSGAHLRSLLLRRGATDFSDGEEPSDITRNSSSASDFVSNRHRWNTYRRRWSSPVGSRRWHRRRGRSESTGMESKDAICSSEMGSISERPSLLPENRVEIDRDNVADPERKDDKKNEDVADKQNSNHMTRMTGEVYMFMITIMIMMVVVLLALMMVTVVVITIVMWTMLSIIMMRWAMKILS
ncbi:ankyrin repeat domain-containing protein [Aspergillus melleus]|uniref:ankyrin repeat domain-containing protein n=1 Tax=Aspergillus melleus TaxID=138277 RepID=UPI001E8D0296|nr:uncharacterized protein LDX57_008172 [Aspergillus melleus]KAH8430510.1 hypothetical protein LDX57_008172 [Aspergillus melleus]